MKCQVLLSFLLVLKLAACYPQFDGSITPGRLDLNHNLGNGKESLQSRGFLQQDSAGKVGSYGAGATYNNNGHSLGYDHSRTPNSFTNSLRGTANVFDDGRNRVNVNAFGSRTRFQRQVNHFDHYGGSVDWKNHQGHGAEVGYEKFPQIQREKVFANGNVNLYQSPNRQTSLDAYGGVSKDIGNFNRGQLDKNVGLRFNHRF